MTKIAGPNLVHAESVTTHGIYPTCNKGLLVGTATGTLKYYFGSWKETTQPLSCTKCIKITGDNQ